MKGITAKIIATIGGSFFILLVVTGFIITSYNSTAFLSNEESIIETTGQLIEEKVENYFQRYSTMAETMATDQNVQNIMETTGTGENIEESPYFEDVYKMLVSSQKLEADTIQTTYIADVDANVLFDSDRWISGDDYDVTTREWYRTVTEQKLIISEPYEDATTKNQVVTISAPVYDKTGMKVLGITAVDIEISKLTDMVNAQSVGKTGFIMLCSPNNNILSHRDSSKVLKSLGNIGLGDNIISAVNQNNSSLMEYDNEGVATIGNYLPVGDTGWKIITAIPKAEFYSNVNHNNITIIVIYIICILLMLILLYINAHRIVKPLKNLTNVTTRLAQGELDIEISVHSKDEVGRLAHSLTLLITRLRDYIVYIDEISKTLVSFADGDLNLSLTHSYEGEFSKIKDALIRMYDIFNRTIQDISMASEQVNEGADQVSSGAQSLSSSSTEQASSMERLSETVTQISGEIKKNATNAQNASDIAVKVGNEIETSNEKMTEMTQAITDISNSSKEIGKIIKTIEDIAFQTNILALNAAVEAARAGAAGKGFAVVADEVRNLATKSASAAKDTTELIENTVLSVENGTRIAKDTAESLHSVVQDAKGVVDTVQIISNATEQIAEFIEQVTEGMEQITGAIQTNSATAEQSAAASEELAGQAQMLKDLVQHFKLSEQNT